MPITRWMGKQNVAYPHNRTILGNIKEQITDMLNKMNKLSKSLHQMQARYKKRMD